MANSRYKLCIQENCCNGPPRPLLYDCGINDFDATRFCSGCGKRLIEVEPIQSIRLPTPTEATDSVHSPEPSQVTLHTGPATPTETLPNKRQSVTSEDSRIEGFKKRRLELREEDIEILATTTTITVSNPSPAPDADNTEHRITAIEGYQSDTQVAVEQTLSTSSSSSERDQMNTAEAAKQILQARKKDHKWCLNCHRVNHTTSECNVPHFDKEPLVADFYWKPSDIRRPEEVLKTQPYDVIQMMDRFEAHSRALKDVEIFQTKRDAMLKSLLQDPRLVQSLKPKLKQGETAVDLYEVLFARANHATKQFLILIREAFEVCHKRIFTSERPYDGPRETSYQFRKKIASDLLHYPNHFQLDPNLIETLQNKLKGHWRKYELIMDNLENKYVTERYSDIELSVKERRLACLPTTYFRLNVVKRYQERELWLPIFITPRVHNLSDYLSEIAHLRQDRHSKSTSVSGTGLPKD